MPNIARFLPGKDAPYPKTFPTVGLCCRTCQVAWSKSAGKKCWMCRKQGSVISGPSAWRAQVVTHPNITVLA